MPPFDASTPVAPLPIALRPVTVDDYHAMAKAGIFREDERVELLDGCLLPMTALGTPHLIVTNRLATFLSRHVGLSAYHVSVHNSVRLDDRSEAKPDIAVAVLHAAYADAGRHPIAEDALLIVEVADTTLRTDRDVKRPRYAAAGIPHVWIVSIQGRWIETAHDPEGDGYRTVERFSATSDRPLVPALLPDLPPLDITALF